MILYNCYITQTEVLDMKAWDILSRLEATDSKNDKQRIIAEQAAAKNTEFFEGLRLALDAMITFGVKQVEPKAARRPNEPEPRGLSHEKFLALCNDLSARRLTGDAARIAIVHASHQATEEQWNGWYRRILIKDLKAGFSESTVNKAVGTESEYAIPVFECQLAKDLADEDGNIDESELHGKKLIEGKMDGCRVITIVYPGGKVDQYSRNGKEFLNFTKIKSQIAKTAKFFAEPTVLDGEVMSANFQDLMKQARRKSDVDADDSVLHLFDILTLREFRAGIGEHKQIDRSCSLQLWYGAVSEIIPNVTVVGQELVDLDSVEGQQRLAEINKHALNQGLEGIMIKDVNAVYECTRSKNWGKFKPFIEETLTVVAMEEGDSDSKFVGILGALVCEGDVDGKPVRVKVGSGYSTKLRAQLWADYTGKPVEWKKKEDGEWVTYTEQPTGSSAIGMLAEVRADALTKSDNSNTYSMRFPRFKTFRGFAKGEKI